MVELLVLILIAYTISKALRRVITPLWTVLEILVWLVLGAALWLLERWTSTELVLTAIVGIALIATWALGRHVRELREDISRLNEEVARR